MSNRLKGTLLGVAASLLGVVLWLIFYLVLGIIAGIAGALMGCLFFWVYRQFNKENESKFEIVFATVLILVEVILSELLVIMILSNTENVSIVAIIKANRSAFVSDLTIGIALSYICFIGFVLSIKRRTKLSKNQNANIPQYPYPQQSNSEYNNPYNPYGNQVNTSHPDPYQENDSSYKSQVENNPNIESVSNSQNDNN